MALADDLGRIAVRVTANANEDAVTLPAEGGGRVLLVRTTSTPEHGRANKAVIALLAQAIGRPPSLLTVVRGQTSRDKLIGIALRDPS